MKQSGNFITSGRAMIPFTITRWPGAMAFLPASIIFVRQAPDALAVHGNLSHFAGTFISNRVAELLFNWKTEVRTIFARPK
jgi:hypothetical protein